MGIAVDTAARRADLISKCMNPMHIEYIRQMDERARAANDHRWSYASPEASCYDIQQTAREARLFTATKDLMDLTVTMSKTLPPQSVELMDLPCDDGYLHLPYPLIVTDVRGEPIPLSTVMWSRRITNRRRTEPGAAPSEQEGVALWLFTSLGEDAAHPVRKGLSAADFERFRMSVPIDSMFAPTFFGFGDEQWHFEDTVKGSRENIDLWRLQRDEAEMVLNENGTYTLTTPNGGKVIGMPNPITTFLQTYWHLCQSELSALENEYPDRRMAKSFKRQGLPLGPCTIVMLRRHQERVKGEDGKWTLQYRRWIKPYWRRQWYGSGDAKYSRHILVSGYVRGPEDAPWVDTPVVNILGR